MRMRRISILVSLGFLISAPVVAQSFRRLPPVPIGHTPVSMISADFNRDGFTDLAIATSDNYIVVMLGAPNATFQVGYEQQFPSVSRPLSAGDVNHDGRLDLAFTTDSGTSILLGAGDGRFGPPVATSFPRGGVLADLDGDGKADLVLAQAVADVNHDGKAEVFAQSEYGVGTGTPPGGFYTPASFTYALSNGDGTYQPSRTYNEPAAVGVALPNAPRFGEEESISPSNGIHPMSQSRTVYSVMFGYGASGTFTSLQRITLTGYTWGSGGNYSSAGSLTFVDLNRDGFTDLLAIATDTNSSYMPIASRVVFTAGNAAGLFGSTSTILSPGTFANMPVAADFNHDGKLDVGLIASCADMFSPSRCDSSFLSIFNGSGAGLTLGASYTTPSVAGVVAADLNGDGRPDVAYADASSDSITILLEDDSVVPALPVITQTFTPAYMRLNDSGAPLTIRIKNPDAPPASGLGFTDTLPDGLMLYQNSSPLMSNTCGGTVVAPQAGNTFSLSGGSVGYTCSVVVNVVGTTAGLKTNSVTLIGGSGNTSTATVDVLPPVRVRAAFDAAILPLNGTTRLNYTLTNASVQTRVTGIQLDHWFYSNGFTTSSPLEWTNGCGGTLTSNVGTQLVNVEKIVLEPGASCSVSIKVLGFYPGTYDTTVYASSTEAGTGSTKIRLIVRDTNVLTEVVPLTGWWWDPAQPGMGFFIERQNLNVFFAAYGYDFDGTPTWVTSLGPMTGAVYSGDVHSYRNGQTLTGAYQTPKDDGKIGDLVIKFKNESEATLTWFGRTFPIRKFYFTNAGPAAELGPLQDGWWWNPVESGRGFALETRDNTLFMAVYGYSAQGPPMWHLTTGMFAGQNYADSWRQYSDGPTFNVCNPFFGGCGPFRLFNANAGAISLIAVDTMHAKLTLPDGRVIPLVRFAF